MVNSMHLDDDKRSAYISVDGDYTADELHELIVRLMSLRGRMRPAVPTLPNMEDESSLVSCAEEGGFSLSTSSDGRTRLYLRHSGLGWVTFTFREDHAILLRDYLAANTPRDGAINLISDETDASGTVQ